MLKSGSTRREFLTASTAAALSAALAGKAKAAPENAAGEWRNRRDGMAYRRLGRTNFMISEVVCGGSTITPTNHSHVETAIERGLNYLDTAASYGKGQSELGYSRVIAGSSKREKVFLASKVSPWDINRNRALRELYEGLSASEKAKIDGEVRERLADAPALVENYFGNYFKSQRKEYQDVTLSRVMEDRFPDTIDRPANYRDVVIRSVEESLKRLGTDYLDILMCPHGASSYDEVTKFPEIFEAFERLKKAGKVRHLGASSHSDPARVLQGVVDAGAYSVSMVAYNIVNHSFMDETMAKAHAADLGVIAMKVARPVDHGRKNYPPDDPKRVALIEKAMPGPMKIPVKAYLWALRNPLIAAVNSEMNNQQMVDDNLPVAGKKV